MPPVLTAPVRWSRPVTKPAQTPDLTPDERANVKAALRVLRRRFGGWKALGEAMGAKWETVRTAAGGSYKPGVGLALRAARMAGVPLEDVLSGAWPVAGACPHCGRT